MKSRMLTINVPHGHFEEFGVSLRKGLAYVGQPASVLEYPGSGLPEAILGLGEIL